MRNGDGTGICDVAVAIILVRSFAGAHRISSTTSDTMSSDAFIAYNHLIYTYTLCTLCTCTVMICDGTAVYMRLATVTSIAVGLHSQS